MVGVDDQLAFFDALFGRRFLDRGDFGRFPLGLFVGPLFEHDVILQLLFDAVVERHDRQLENLHRLDHARSQLHLLAHLHVLRKIQLHDLC